MVRYNNMLLTKSNDSSFKKFNHSSTDALKLFDLKNKNNQLFNTQREFSSRSAQLILISILLICFSWFFSLHSICIDHSGIDGHLDPYYAIYGIVWMYIFQQPAYCIYVAFQSIGKLILILSLIFSHLGAYEHFNELSVCTLARSLVQF